MKDIGKSFLDDLVTEVVAETVRKIGENKIEEGVNYVKKRLKDISERLDKLWLKQFVDHWRKRIAYRKEQEQKKLELLGSFPSLLPVKSGLICRRRDDYSLDKAFIDFSSLFFEQKINVFIEKRHARIARKVLTKWHLWTQLQIEKREFFTTTYTTSPLKRRQRLYNNNNDDISKKNDDKIRLTVALAEVECERLKPFQTTYQIYNENEQQLSWYKSLVERSSLLLDYFDEKTLEKGVEIAERNMQRIDCTQRWIKNENHPGYSGSFDKFTFDQRNYKKTNEFSVENEEYHPPTKKEVKFQI
ncbi:unnamed protein product [Onchocerca flexuosa]|uniref:Sfi1 spindle body domain-containing protein n=1 Tax=Onchocerca flexuosa TaxID=387005 RepID=A0A183HCF3_9BILA|nr:unnamed protein product [Onchocerca flexuosa]